MACLFEGWSESGDHCEHNL